jgi:hypothetical protein
MYPIGTDRRGSLNVLVHGHDRPKAVSEGHQGGEQSAPLLVR